jgi:DNA-binding NtrC family response regulator
MSAQLDNGRILIVDDDQQIRRTLRSMLERLYCVLCAPSVGHALRHILAYRPHVVLLDVNMPGEDGLQGLREIREADPEVAVVMMAGEPSVGAIATACRQGADAFLCKPFTRNDLREKMVAAVETKRYLADSLKFSPAG